MNRSAIYISLVFLFVWASSAQGINVHFSDEVSGTGSFKQEHHVANEVLDYAEVSVDVKEANQYNYSYSTYSDGNLSRAQEVLNVVDAKSVRSSGEARNRDYFTVFINTVIDNGGLAYNNSVVASYQGVFAHQNVSEASGDKITIDGRASGPNNTNGTKMPSARNAARLTNGSIWGYGGYVAISANGSEVSSCQKQAFSNTTGPAYYETSVSMGENTSSTNVTIDRGCMIELDHNLSQSITSSRVDVTYSRFECELPDSGNVTSALSAHSNECQANTILVSDDCEYLQESQTVGVNGTAVISHRVDAISGPLVVESRVYDDDRMVDLSAYMVGGFIHIDQNVNGTEVCQDSRGVGGSFDFNTSTTNVGGNRIDISTAAGSGNLICMTQKAAESGTFEEMEYEYMPVSYQSSVSDELYAVSTSYVSSNESLANTTIVAEDCEHLQESQTVEVNGTAAISQEVNAVSGPLTVESHVSDDDHMADLSADMLFGVVSIDQDINETKTFQEAKGVSGGVALNTSISDSSGCRINISSAVGSGNLICMTQKVAESGTFEEMEYEYMSVSYQSSVSDELYAVSTSYVSSNESLANTTLVANNCEHLQESQTIRANRTAIISQGVNAIAGPLTVESHASDDNCTADLSAYMAGGIIHIDQNVNGTEVCQDSKGVGGSFDFNTSTTNAGGNSIDISTAAGSGNLICMTQKAAESGIFEEMKYEFIPTTYRSGLDVYHEHYARSNSSVQSNEGQANTVLVADDCENLQERQILGVNGTFVISHEVNVTSGPLTLESHVSDNNQAADLTAHMHFGVISVDQNIDETEIRQNSRGMCGGIALNISANDARGNKIDTSTTTGSGSISLMQNFSTGLNMFNTFDYSPVSFGDDEYNVSLLQANVYSEKAGELALIASLRAENCDDVEGRLSAKAVEDVEIRQGLHTNASEGQILWTLASKNYLEGIKWKYLDADNSTLLSELDSSKMIELNSQRNFTSCDPFIKGQSDLLFNHSLRIPDPQANSTWNRSWGMDLQSSYSSVDEIQLMRGNLKWDRSFKAKRTDCRD